MKLTAIGRTLILSTASACLLGCGSDASKPKLGKVSGKVSYNGQPVTKGIVMFIPPRGGPGAQTGQSATGGVLAGLGEIGSDGSYTLSTIDKGDGAVLGEHTVTVRRSVVPEKFATEKNSPLRYTVHEGSQIYDIELKD